MKSIIPAAGLGTRFLPGTKVTPKEMLPVLDKPALRARPRGPPGNSRTPLGGRRPWQGRHTRTHPEPGS